MKILYWTQLYRPYIGGVEVLAPPFIAAMRAYGHEFIIVTSHGFLDLPDTDDDAGVPIYRFDFQGALARRDVGAILRLRKSVAALKRDFAPDIIEINLSDPSIFFHVQTTTAAKTIIAVRVAPPERIAAGDTLLGQAFSAASWITANSQAVLDDLHRIAPKTAARSSVIYNGLPMPPLMPAPLPFDSPVLLCVGRMVIEKGFDLAIRTLAILQSRFPDLRLILAGDGPVRSDLERLAGELAIAHAVDFPGWVNPEAIPALINTATVVLMPSRWREAFGLVALQAGQMARPVVAADVGGLPEVVAHGQSGWVVPSESPEAIADAVASLLYNPVLAVQMGQNGRERAEQLFGWQAHIDQYHLLYQHVLKGNAHVDPIDTPATKSG